MRPWLVICEAVEGRAQGFVSARKGFVWFVVGFGERAKAEGDGARDGAEIATDRTGGNGRRQFTASTDFDNSVGLSSRKK